MDYSALSVAIVALVFAWFLLRPRRNLPPGPYPFPIIGNIPQLGRQPHKSLTDLSKTYGPLMSLRLGSIYTVVASSPEAAKLVLQTHDHAFSGRSVPAAAEVHGFHQISSGLIPVGEKWRNLRRLFKEQLFSSGRLESGKGLRREKVQRLVEYVKECSGGGRAVNLGEAAFVTALNLLTVTFFSVDLIDFDSEDSQELKETINGVTKILGTPNVADFFPFLKRLDPQGIKRRSEFYIGKLLAVMQGLIDERLESRSSAAAVSPRKSDMLETVLDSVQGGELDITIKEVQQLFLDLFIGGSDSTQGTVEWVMAELIANPEKMRSLKNELRSIIGNCNEKQVEESDISRLPYLRAVIKETLRLHPAAPFLIPRRADGEVKINGDYSIPRNTQIFVNVWAIGRNPSVWSDPDLFEPERFLDVKIDYKGQDFVLLPFGSGRRMCPGVALADRMLHLMVASLVHNFRWEMEEGKRVDMTEEFGIGLHKAIPLKAVPIPS